MTLIAAIDFETTGLDPKKDRIVEVGAVLWDWEAKKPLILQSDLVRSVTSISKEASAINGIRDEDLINYGVDPYESCVSLGRILAAADHLLGHNIRGFDIPFLLEEFKRVGENTDARCFGSVIDTMVDVPYTHMDSSRKLAHLASAHGILNAFPHRAVFDALTALQIASKYDLKAILTRAKSPTVTYKAVIEYEDRDKAKAAGFQWRNRTWVRTVKECDRESYPFATIRVGE